MRTGIPCYENRFFPVWKTTHRKPCSGPVLALYGIAVYPQTRVYILYNVCQGLVNSVSYSIHINKGLGLLKLADIVLSLIKSSTC